MDILWNYTLEYEVKVNNFSRRVEETEISLARVWIFFYNIK